MAFIAGPPSATYIFHFPNFSVSDWKAPYAKWMIQFTERSPYTMEAHAPMILEGTLEKQGPFDSIAIFKDVEFPGSKIGRIQYMLWALDKRDDENNVPGKWENDVLHTEIPSYKNMLETKFCERRHYELSPYAIAQNRLAYAKTPSDGVCIPTPFTD